MRRRRRSFILRCSARCEAARRLAACLTTFSFSASFALSPAPASFFAGPAWRALGAAAAAAAGPWGGRAAVWVRTWGGDAPESDEPGLAVRLRGRERTTATWDRCVPKQERCAPPGAARPRPAPVPVRDEIARLPPGTGHVDPNSHPRCHSPEIHTDGRGKVRRHEKDTRRGRVAACPPRRGGHPPVPWSREAWPPPPRSSPWRLSDPVAGLRVARSPRRPRLPGARESPAPAPRQPLLAPGAPPAGGGEPAGRAVGDRVPLRGAPRGTILDRTSPPRTPRDRRPWQRSTMAGGKVSRTCEHCGERPPSLRRPKTGEAICK